MADRAPRSWDTCRMTDTLRGLKQPFVSHRELRPAGSYSAELFADHERLMRKVMEEAFEVCLEARPRRARPRGGGRRGRRSRLPPAGRPGVGRRQPGQRPGRPGAAAAMTVRVALPSRGRLRDGVLSLLDDAGYPAAVLNGAVRAATAQTEFIEMRPRDAGAWLATGRIAGAFTHLHRHRAGGAAPRPDRRAARAGRVRSHRRLAGGRRPVRPGRPGRRRRSPPTCPARPVAGSPRPGSMSPW